MIHYASVHEQGGRKYQEDFLGVFCQNDFGVFALADGLGGHGLGDLASECVVRYAVEQYVPGCEASEYFQEVFLGGNERLLQIQDQRNDMRSAKTTLVCAVVEEGMLQAAYIGDSRLYFFPYFSKSRIKIIIISIIFVRGRFNFVLLITVYRRCWYKLGKSGRMRSESIRIATDY